MADPPRCRRIALIALCGGLGLLALAWVCLPAVIGLPTPHQFRQAYQPSEAWLLDRHGVVLQSRRIDESARRLPWVPLAEVSPALVEAVIQSEDRRFRWHYGVDLLAVAAALRDALGEGRLRGASTLTMQLAARIDPALSDTVAGHRPLPAKLRQAVAATALEMRWTKEEILEAYLNVVPFRGELVGIAAAAEGLFGRAPLALDNTESWLLAASLRAPNAPPELMARRACEAATRESDVSRPDCAAIWSRAQALRKAVPIRAEGGLTPHLSQRMLKLPGQRVETTLDAELQRKVHEVLAERLVDLGADAVRDGAALVVDNATGEVRAWVGSAGPASSAAMVDGVLARRQAGSTLKPFLYALALELRVLTPASLLDDSPAGIDTGVGLYVPQNYDRRFRGHVSLRTALASSLNVPAVRTVELVGLPRLHALLGQLGYAGLEPDPDFYGTSLALGSPEVTLLEQVAAYRALADAGKYRPLRWLAGADGRESKQVIDPAVAWLIGDILADRTARAATFGFASPLATPGWAAAKTGTSVEMRDNWCIGFNRHYTVGVWVGNFEGDPMRDVSGVSGAAPAWFEIMRLLQGSDETSSPDMPAALVEQRVSFDAGIEADRREFFLAGTEIDRVRLAGPATRPARIIMPSRGLVIAVDPDIPAGRQRLPLIADGAIEGLEFYVNGRRVNGAAWRPVNGRHQVTLQDESGRIHDAVEVLVR